MKWSEVIFVTVWQRRCIQKVVDSHKKLPSIPANVHLETKRSSEGKTELERVKVRCFPSPELVEKGRTQGNFSIEVSKQPHSDR
jgi:hypothetical protein